MMCYKRHTLVTNKRHIVTCLRPPSSLIVVIKEKLPEQQQQQQQQQKDALQYHALNKP